MIQLLLFIHTYHSRLVAEGVAEVSQIFLRDAHLLPKWHSYVEYCRRDRWLTHHRLNAVSGGYLRHPWKKERGAIFCSVPDTRDLLL
jgi:hypothetical protein